MKTIVTLLTMSLLVAFLGGLMTGCGVAAVALEKSREASSGDISIAKTPAYDPDLVAVYDKVLVLSHEAGGVEGIGSLTGGYTGLAKTGGASAALLSGRIALELAKLGYDVLEQDALDLVSSDEEQNLIELAVQLEVDAIITVTTQQGSVSKLGTFGLGAGLESGIIGTTVKLVDINTTRTIAVVSSDYPEPRTATEVSEGLVPSLYEVLGKSTPSSTSDGNQ